jgi:hypothetical protein
MAIRQILRDRVSALEIACWIICLLAGVVLLINKMRNKTLDQSMLALNWTSIAIAQWVHDRSLLGTSLSAFLALWSAMLARALWMKNRPKLDKPSETPIRLEGKS